MKRGLLVFVLATALTACAPTLQAIADLTGTEIVATDVRQKAYKAASVSFTAWESIQQAALRYGRLPPCDTEGMLLCRDQAAWDRIKEIESQTSATLLAARPLIEAGESDVELLMSIPGVVADAQKAISDDIADGSLQPLEVKP